MVIIRMRDQNSINHPNTPIFKEWQNLIVCNILLVTAAAIDQEILPLWKLNRNTVSLSDIKTGDLQISRRMINEDSQSKYQHDS